ncbi:methyltransferase domain-containing protein [Parahaliea maris]|uniref:Methyltransferase domain-containing protein n=1 Tax=Parahaliea maris TaxID=2716870 RepID=A0A5C9A508_9GAMM|nr:methyltransferase domain-containing protein [Parahaliea maris]
MDALYAPRRGLMRQAYDRASGKEFNEILTELETWYRTPKGQYLLACLEARLAGELDTAFGYHLAQVAVTGCHPLFDSSPIRHRIYIASEEGPSVGLRADADELPLASDSVDVLIAFHSLEFCDNPHQALREMHRVLTPQGHLFIVGFNPVSLPGLGMAIRARSGSPLWRSRRSLTTWRLNDWLSLLGLEVENVQHCYALAPLGKGRLRDTIERCNAWSTRHGLPVGGVYVVHAMKQVAGQVRPLQRARSARLIDLAVPKPAPTPRPAATPRSKGDTAA